jgi:hypothetical protein
VSQLVNVQELQYSSADLNAGRLASAVRMMMEVVMRKFLILALLSTVFAATACTKSEETPAPEASAEASPAATDTSSPVATDTASPAASDAAPMASPSAS